VDGRKTDNRSKKMELEQPVKDRQDIRRGTDCEQRSRVKPEGILEKKERVDAGVG